MLMNARKIGFLFAMALVACGGKDEQIAASTIGSGAASDVRKSEPESKPAFATGDFTTHSTTTGVQQSNGMLLVSQDVTFTVTGGLSGTATAKDIILLNSSTGTGFFSGLGTLTGTVLGRSGTIAFVFNGTFSGYPTRPVLQGQIVFLPGTGTGQLAGMTGEGTLQGIIDVGGTYSIQVAFGSRTEIR
jgi:Protein of unknown function (DUF3224)